MISESDAAMLANASAGLLAMYGGELDPRAVAWANFGMAAITVYGPRIVAVGIRQQRERAAQREKQSTDANAG